MAISIATEQFIAIVKMQHDRGLNDSNESVFLSRDDTNPSFPIGYFLFTRNSPYTMTLREFSI